MSTSAWLGFLLPELIGVALISLAAFVARNGWSQRSNRLFAALYLLSGVKSLADGLLAVGDGMQFADQFHAAAPLFPAAATWLHVQVVCALFMVPLLLLFIATFPKPTRLLQRFPALHVVVFLPSVALAWAAISDPGRASVLPFLIAFEVLASIVTIGALIHLLRVRMRADDARERTQATYLLLGFLPAFVVTWALTVDNLVFYNTGESLAGPRSYDLLIHYVSPVLEFVAALVVGYAILKYRLLNIELQVKGGVKYVLISAILGTFLFVASTYIGNFVLQNQIFSFAGPEGSAALAGVGTILLFKPVEKVSARVTDRLFPETTSDPKAYAKQRAREIYRVQCMYVLRDAHASDRELEFLLKLRSQLEIGGPEARGIEEEVERALGVDDARMGNAGRLQRLAASARDEMRVDLEVKAASPSHRDAVADPQSADGAGGAEAVASKEN